MSTLQRNVYNYSSAFITIYTYKVIIWMMAVIVLGYKPEIEGPQNLRPASLQRQEIQCPKHSKITVKKS